MKTEVLRHIWTHVTKAKTPDLSGVHKRFTLLEEKADSNAAALVEVRRENKTQARKEIIISTMIAVVLMFPSAWFGAHVGTDMAIAAQEATHRAYIDARRPCVTGEDKVFDLAYPTLTLYVNETGAVQDDRTVTFQVDGTPLHFYVVHLTNNGTGDLRDLRLSVILPGSAYATTTSRREASIDAVEGERTIILGREGLPATISQDPRLTFARGFNDTNGTPSQPLRYTMPSGAKTPENWTSILRWSPNVVNATGNEIVAYTLPALPPKSDWWIGTAYYQPTLDWNVFDKGATLTGWSDGYDGPLYAATDLRALYADESNGSLTEFCSWEG